MKSIYYHVFLKTISLKFVKERMTAIQDPEPNIVVIVFDGIKKQFPKIRLE